MKESAAEPQKIRRKNSVSEVIGRCDSGIGASIRENEEKHMITGEVEAVDRKQKIRDRYKGVDISELEVIPAKIIEDLETSSVIRRVAAYEENTTIMPPEKQIVQDDRDARAEELESAFSYDGYQVVRKELFAHLRDPAIVIRKDSITFNTACITGLEDVVYVHVMFNNDLKRIVVRGCDENDKDALRWCVAKPDKRKSRKMSCKPFATLVYQKMGWDSECRYKMLGYRITFEGETLYVFDLLVPEIFHEGQRKKNAVDSQDNAASTKPVNSRKGFYLDDIVGTFGVPVEEHRKESEVKQMDGYVSMGILTGKIAPEAGKD